MRQLVCVSAAWRLQQLTGFLDVGASMMGVQSQIGDVLDQVDRMEGLCVDLKRQVKDDTFRSPTAVILNALLCLTTRNQGREPLR